MAEILEQNINLQLEPRISWTTGLPITNPSPLHDELANRSLRWLNNRCGKLRAELEMALGEKYIVDAAGIGHFHDNEFRKRIYANGHLPIWREIIPYDFRASRGEHIERWMKLKGQKEIKYINYLIFVFEVKVSRADFLSTFKRENGNRLEPIGSFHWCVTPRGLIKPEELPENWGLLEAYGVGLSEKRVPIYNQVTEKFMMEFAENMLWKNHLHRADHIPACPDCGKKFSSETD